MELNLDIRDLCFSFGPERHRLSNISLEVPAGELCCLLGPNGAGKTTLIRCIMGFLSPSAGVIQIAGHDASRLSPRQLARLVAYVPQTTTTIFPFTALDMAVMGRTPYLGYLTTPSVGDRRHAEATLEELGIGHLAHRVFGQLSGGERQLTMISRALVQEAPLLVLDEPTSALDYGNEVRILRVIANLVAQGRSVLMTTHQPNHALLWGHRAVLLSDGSIVASGPAEAVITAERLSDLYGVPIGLSRLDGGSQRLICHPDVDLSPSAVTGRDLRVLDQPTRR